MLYFFINMSCIPFNYFTHFDDQKTIYYTKTEQKEFFFNFNVVFIWTIYVLANDEESISIDKTFYNSSSYRIAFSQR